jgi:hypothetical protein
LHGLTLHSLELKLENDERSLKKSIARAIPNPLTLRRIS